MEAFKILLAQAAPLPAANIDTDIIVPARFLTITEKRGLGRHAFADWRASGSFVLDEPGFRQAKILVAGPNFGCGSSREQAAWALADLGIRCVIAQSFGEIFRANALRNGILPIVLQDEVWRHALAVAERAGSICVDLVSGEIDLGDGPAIAFTMNEQERVALLNGWDEIDGIAARYTRAIAEFEARQRAEAPWLWERETNHA